MPVPFQEITQLIFQRELEKIHGLQYVFWEQFYI